MKKETIGILCGDIEFTYKNPISRTDSYGNDILDKLYQIVKLSKQIKADFVCFSGDFMNRKYDFNCKEIIALQVVFKHFDIPIIAIAGNHDIVGYNFSSKNYKPIGILEQTGIKILNNDEIKINNVLISGTSYYRNIDIDREAYYYHGNDKDNFKIGLTHGCLIGFGTENSPNSFFGDFTTIKDIEDTNYDLIFNGHWHQNQGILNRNGKIFCNIGSIGRDDISLYNHKPQVLVVKIDENNNSNIELFPLKINNPENVFIISEEKQEQDDTLISDYMRELINHDKNNSFISDIDLIHKVIQDKNVSDDVKRVIEQIIEENDYNDR